MGATGNKNVNSIETGGEKPILPGAKLPPPDGGTVTNAPTEIRKAWIDYMVRGFKNNEEMFRRTLEAFMKPYHLTIWLYGVLFAIGIMLFVVAAMIGLRDSKSVVAIVFAGLGAGAFFVLLYPSAGSGTGRESRIHHMAGRGFQHLLDPAYVHTRSENGSARTEGRR